MATIEDILQLRNHDKVRFKGNWEPYVENLHPSEVKKAIRRLTSRKPLTVYYVADELKGRAQAAAVQFYGGPCIYIKPEQAKDWEPVEFRHSQVETVRKSKLGINGAKQTLKRFQAQLQEVIFQNKSSFDYYLRDILLDKKMELLAGLKGPDRIAAELFFTYKDDVADLLNKWNIGHEAKEK